MVDQQYIVRARSDQVALFRQALGDGASVFVDSMLFTKREGGRSVRGPREWTDEMKLIFLLYLHDMYLAEEPQDDVQGRFQSGLRSLIGDPPWDVETFERLWSIERVVDEEDAEEIRQSATPAGRATVPALARWLEHGR